MIKLIEINKIIEYSTKLSEYFNIFFTLADDLKAAGTALIIVAGVLGVVGGVLLVAGRRLQNPPPVPPRKPAP